MAQVLVPYRGWDAQSAALACRWPATSPPLAPQRPQKWARRLSDCESKSLQNNDLAANFENHLVRPPFVSVAVCNLVKVLDERALVQWAAGPT